MRASHKAENAFKSPAARSDKVCPKREKLVNKIIDKCAEAWDADDRPNEIDVEGVAWKKKPKKKSST